MGGRPVESCHTCKYVSDASGNHDGNQNCGDSPSPDMSRPCPVYASAACYTGSALHDEVKLLVLRLKYI